MTPHEAKEILATWRPGESVDRGPDFTAALSVADRDPDVRAWFHQHQAFQSGTRAALRAVQAPDGLAARVVAASKVTRPRFAWLQNVGIAAAALMLMAGIWMALPSRSPENINFNIYRNRMVRAALREYRMDIVTNDLSAIRAFFSGKEAPSDFELPPNLASLRPVGGGLLRWRGAPVSMVCLDGKQLGMLFLFVASTQDVAPGAPATTTLAKVNKLSTASWSRDAKTYLLATSAPIEEVGNLP